ncbi:hypothetical protein FQY83_13385 [Luteimonas marina]|uniref:Uncharacterized protein n=1 Tax=Luteimonas marina TaxID=488485 RepID=A0A5C5TZ37_9GAMM|nr:hypothetical protein [Luteimonas marina]TWT19343.1 hypothetical protein FQY83_13385 [Luteimonas marina]
MDGTPGAGRTPLRPIMAAVMAASLATTGCQGMAMTTQDVASQGAARPDNTVADWPLKFVQHNFGAFSHSTYGCVVDYNGFRHLSEPDDVLQPAVEDVHPDSRGNMPSGYIGVMNFPAPARVRWRSKDGSAHEVEVDIAAIFRDQLILHEVPREDVAEGVSILNPDILLEVDDRTINVHMRARIPTKSLRTPGNPHSDFRRDLVLAWSRTY